MAPVVRNRDRQRVRCGPARGGGGGGGRWGERGGWESRCADRQLLRLEERGGIDAVGRKHFSS